MTNNDHNDIDEDGERCDEDDDNEELFEKITVLGHSDLPRLARSLSQRSLL